MAPWKDFTCSVAVTFALCSNELENSPSQRNYRSKVSSLTQYVCVNTTFVPYFLIQRKNESNKTATSRSDRAGSNTSFSLLWRKLPLVTSTSQRATFAMTLALDWIWMRKSRPGKRHYLLYLTRSKKKKKMLLLKINIVRLCSSY